MFSCLIVSLGKCVCTCIHVCLIDCWWKQSNDSVSLSWPSLSLLVSLFLMPVFPFSVGCVCLAEQQPSLSSCRAVWSVFAQPSVPAPFSPCVESMGSPWRPLRSTALPCVGGEWALPPIYLPLIYHSISTERVNHIQYNVSLFRNPFAHCTCTCLSSTACKYTWDELCFSSSAAPVFVHVSVSFSIA